LVAVAFFGRAHAEPSSSGARSTTAGALTPCTDVAAPGDYEHDGFYLKGDLGLAFLSELVDAPGSPTGRTRIRGFGESSVISIGGTPLRGLVLGGTIWTARISPSFVQRGKVVSPDDDSVKETLARFGPFVDFYPDPSRGFHTQAAVLLAIQVESDTKGNLSRPAAIGVAAAFGAGYDWFVSKQFSLGFIARLTFGYSSRTVGGSSERSLWETPEVALSYTYQ
jgi:hypothetical protein